MGEDATGYPRKLELLLERFRRGDGERWKKREIERATGGRVSAAYVSALGKGKIRRPGPEMLALLADVMGFPPRLWDLEPEAWDAELEAEGARGAFSPPTPGGSPRRRPASPADDELPALGGRDLALLLGRLFEHMPNRRTGRAHTDAEVEALSDGAVCRGDLERMRSGESPPVAEDKLLALCDVFDVGPEYWRVLPDEQVRLEGVAAIERFLAEEFSVGAHRGAHSGLSEKDRDMLRTIVETLGRNVTGRRRKEAADGRAGYGADGEDA